ncbi:NADH-quinone oxidoreductase subunit J [Pelomonas sp. KK5]|uniref:NADH-quinone oxidoreductase subunit J n=1 Tax=Pelomonas sp. KK5 TaxID=1855730 RepID=UPI00097C86EE|nr:NADH-quinone oxidoreductase subunit J [Pelomonas sp. KK5]
MDITTVLFYLFSAVLLGSSFRVITARSTVHSALFLILAFFNASCIWMLLKAEFLAIALVLVYIGAVMVLFLFVVMMLDISSDQATNIREGFWKHLPLALCVGAFIALEMAMVLMGGFRLSDAPNLDAAAVKLGNTKLLGVAIYTQYLYPLEVAAVLLLVGVIAAIALTLRARKDSRSQNASEQVRVKKGDRLKIVKMAPTLPVQPAAEDNKGAA